VTEHKLHALKKKNFRKNIWPNTKKKKGHWRPRSNSEIYEFYKDLNIVDDVKIRRLVWASHIIRIEEERIKKKQFLIGNFTTKFRWENQEGDGRTLSRRMLYRFWEYKAGGEMLGLKKIKVSSGGS
jgi:hypothetical protein